MLPVKRDYSETVAFSNAFEVPNSTESSKSDHLNIDADSFLQLQVQKQQGVIYIENYRQVSSYFSD